MFRAAARTLARVPVSASLRARAGPSIVARTFATKKYTKEHEVISYDNKTRVGTMSISDYAQESLGQVAFVELPTVGHTVAQADPIGTVESTKAASDIYAPVSGEIIEVNTELGDNPGLINKDPEGAGWLVKFKVTDKITSELDALMTEEEYTVHRENAGDH
ncbi:glycine cleavage system H protein [Auriculariales sp. MPI-PUGE-AT-0066]|nr:glycine cleavage system H protein [Auriculariales sp. MPI-PUGE-AT-0066]